MKRVYIIGAIAMAFATGAGAESKPIQVSLFNPVQMFDDKTAIAGLRVNLVYGLNTDMTGLDVGFVNHATGTLKGVQWGGIGIVGNGAGWQFNYLANITRNEFNGLQTGVYNQLHKGKSVQLGLFNFGDHMSGFQLGLFNSVESMHGLQIGLINIIHAKDMLPILPIVNWQF